EWVRGSERRQRQPRRPAASAAGDRLERVLLGARLEGPQAVAERLPDKPQDLRLGPDAVGPGIAVDVHRRLLLPDGAAEDVVVRADVLQLLPEGADALELTGGGREAEALLRH